MSETKLPRDVEWLARCLADQLADDPPDHFRADGTPGGVQDRTWARLLGVAAVPFDESELQIEDVTALVIRLLDFAVDEWLALEQAGEVPGGDSQEVDDPGDRREAEAIIDTGMVGPVVRFADDRTRDEALWSVLADHWRRGAPPFVTVVH